MTQQLPPPTPMPPSTPHPRPAGSVNPIVVVVLVVLAAMSMIAVAVVLVHDARDSGVKTVAPTTVATATTRATATTARAATTVPATAPATVAPTTLAKAASTYGTTPCPPTTGAVTPTRTFTAYFQKCIDATKKYTAVVTTNKGDLTIQLDPVQAPLAVNNFVALARSHYFDSTQCHRIIPAFVVQCGDPTGTGRGGPGYQFVDELPKAGQYKVGSLAMANSGPNTNGSQFFIVSGAQGVALPPSYTLFGQVTAGTDTTLKTLDAAGTAAGTPKEAITITSVRITES
jgi:cyclophilin family peptidyl-prolyl cis-trans isomerase